MPPGSCFIGIGVATAAAIIASQALVIGPSRLLARQSSCIFWPRLAIHTGITRADVHSTANWLLWQAVCSSCGTFKNRHMEAAYGIAITLQMLYRQRFSWQYLKRMEYLTGIVVALSLFLAHRNGLLIMNMSSRIEGG